MIKPLPNWIVADGSPAFYETEGATAIQMVAKLYGKVKEMIEDYNTFVDQVNGEIERFENGMYSSFEEFKTCVQKLMSDYIETIDTKISMQDTKIDNAIASQDSVIADAVAYMKDNLVTTITNLYNAGFEHGDYYSQVSLSYDAPTETLEIIDTMEKAEEEEY